MCLIGAFAPNVASAAILDVDSLDISGLVPVVLDAFMFVANGTYAYFVGKGDGVIYLLVWGFLAFYIALYLIKLYIPKFWLKTFGFQPASATVEGVEPVKIGEALLKPGIRVLVAVLVLLPLKPQFLAEGLINPFLHFGSLYTTEIINVSTGMGLQTSDNKIKCPDNLLEQGWLSKQSCNYLIEPVHVLSKANNSVVKRGFKYLSSGLGSLTSLMSHNGGQGFMNIITGLLLIGTFTACNIFMALLIIQAIFDFGIALILYPFNVAAWVTKQSDDWFNVWPAFSGIIDALKKVIITMIASAFILCVNLALVSALFQWNSDIFVAAVGGTAYSNIPTAGAGSSGFGEHSVLWLSCLLTYFLMNKIFEITRDKLKSYVGKGATDLYDTVKTDVKTSWEIVKNTKNTIQKIRGK